MSKSNDCGIWLKQNARNLNLTLSQKKKRTEERKRQRENCNYVMKSSVSSAKSKATGKRKLSSFEWKCLYGMWSKYESLTEGESPLGSWVRLNLLGPSWWIGGVFGWWVGSKWSENTGVLCLLQLASGLLYTCDQGFRRGVATARPPGPRPLPLSHDKN